MCHIRLVEKHNVKAARALSSHRSNRMYHPHTSPHTLVVTVLYVAVSVLYVVVTVLYVVVTVLYVPYTLVSGAQRQGGARPLVLPLQQHVLPAVQINRKP